LRRRERKKERKRNVYYKTATIGEKDDFDSENSWITEGLPSSSRRRSKGEGRRRGTRRREKVSASEVDLGVDGAKSEIKVERRLVPERSAEDFAESVIEIPSLALSSLSPVIATLACTSACSSATAPVALPGDSKELLPPPTTPASKPLRMNKSGEMNVYYMTALVV